MLLVKDLLAPPVREVRLPSVRFDHQLGMNLRMGLDQSPRVAVVGIHRLVEGALTNGYAMAHGTLARPPDVMLDWREGDVESTQQKSFCSKRNAEHPLPPGPTGKLAAEVLVARLQGKVDRWRNPDFALQGAALPASLPGAPEKWFHLLGVRVVVKRQAIQLMSDVAFVPHVIDRPLGAAASRKIIHAGKVLGCQGWVTSPLVHQGATRRFCAALPGLSASLAGSRPGEEGNTSPGRGKPSNHEAWSGLLS